MWSLFMYCKLSSFILDDNMDLKVGAITNEPWNPRSPLQKQYRVPCTWVIQAVLVYFRLNIAWQIKISWLKLNDVDSKPQASITNSRK